jgi:guanylate kinase
MFTAQQQEQQKKLEEERKAFQDQSAKRLATALDALATKEDFHPLVSNDKFLFTDYILLCTPTSRKQSIGK